MQSFKQSLTIGESHTAVSLGSGSLVVYSTPSLIALMENTATKCIDNLNNGYTTVGIEIHAKHLKASKVGETVTCIATLISQDSGIYIFDIIVTDSSGATVGTGTHKRAAVEIERFMQKLEK